MSDQINLFSIITSGDLPGLKRSLANGASLDIRDERGATPLFVAAFHGQLRIVEFLLQQGVDVNEGNQVKFTPLMAAAREKRVDVTEVLLAAKADTELQAQAGMKALHCSLMDTVPKSGNRPYETETRLIGILKLFKRYGANLNTRGQRGNTPLMDAAWWNLVHAVEFLLAEGANPDDSDNKGQTATDYATMRRAKNLDVETNAMCDKIIKMLSESKKV